MSQKDIEIIRAAVHAAMPEIPPLPGRVPENLACLIERLGEERKAARDALKVAESKLEALRVALRDVLRPL